MGSSGLRYFFTQIYIKLFYSHPYEEIFLFRNILEQSIFSYLSLSLSPHLPMFWRYLSKISININPAIFLYSAIISGIIYFVVFSLFLALRRRERKLMPRRLYWNESSCENKLNFFIFTHFVVAWDILNWAA